MVRAAQYGVILDAGSSGTRIYVYKWKHPSSATKHASAAEMHSLPRLKLEKNKKIHPGVSTFADDVVSVGPDHLQSLVDVALDQVPAAKVPETPVFLMATAGVRFLPKQQQAALLQGICTYLQANTRFDLPDCKSHIQVISGETEGLYGWIAANYLLGGFDRPEEHAHGKGHHTYGFLDMGGASAQIAFAPNTTEAIRHADDLKLVRLRRLDGSPVEYKVFTATWLGFGANKARSRYVESLRDNYDSTVDEIPDPCMPKGLRTTLSGEPAISRKATHGQVLLVGTGAFDECLRKTHPLLRKDAPCEDHPCLLNGQHVPAIDFDVNHFVGVSEYWHTTHGVFGKEHNAYDLATYQHDVMDFCNRDWAAIEADLEKRKKTPEQKAQDAREACFKASWLINVLHDGIGIPRVSLEAVPNPGINTTKEAAEKAKDKGYLDPFQPVDKIDGIEVSWTLGKMVLYAAGQVSPVGSSSLPVGFGSNVQSGTPSDFEHAGSSPLLPITNPDDDDDDDMLIAPSKSTSSLLVLVLVLLLAAYLLRRPERRRRLWSIIRRRRRSGSGRKPTRGCFSLASKLFGWNPTAYERVMEEGEAAEFELGEMDSDDQNYSDSSDGSRAGKAPGLATPRLNIDRFDDMHPPSAMDRNGLVIRTESRERLAPTLQMLNAGRRSRAGSPTRLKSPLVTPLQD
ncbi:Golgi apyrase [Tolypocladium paradoxum]|uniref:Golgi apyrase n=1 Tax=Tolypocladium paradoxum TaxID=94208 RepID=A0A2S4L4Q0_9HYPO|nr:Golgi apyrase [Tolypocladium paradoxum]